MLYALLLKLFQFFHFFDFVTFLAFLCVKNMQSTPTYRHRGNNNKSKTTKCYETFSDIRVIVFEQKKQSCCILLQHTFYSI